MAKRRKSKKITKTLPSRLELLNMFTYDVDTGELRSKKTGKTVGWRDNVGYLIVSVKGSPFKAHRVIYKLFHGVDPKNKVVDHRDGDKCNNRIDNLRCVTHRANILNTEQQRKTKGLPAKDINCTYHHKNRLRTVLKGSSDELLL